MGRIIYYRSHFLKYLTVGIFQYEHLLVLYLMVLYASGVANVRSRFSCAYYHVGSPHNISPPTLKGPLEVLRACFVKCDHYSQKLLSILELATLSLGILTPLSGISNGIKFFMPYVALVSMSSLHYLDFSSRHFSSHDLNH